MGRILEESTSRIISLLREPKLIVGRTSVGWCQGVSGRQL